MNTALTVFILLSFSCLIFTTIWLVEGLWAIYQGWHNKKVALMVDKAQLQLKVVKRQEVGSDILLLTLAQDKEEPLPSFQAGQHLILSLPVSSNEPPLKRCYSLAFWQRVPSTYKLAIKREPQGRGSNWLWQNAKQGSVLASSLPRGDFLLREPLARVILLVAGGIGITPMRSMLQYLSTRSDKVRVVLFHAAINRERLLYREELTALDQKTTWFEYLPILSEPDSNWEGLKGFLEARTILLGARGEKDISIYFCGNAPMTESIKKGLFALRFPEERFHCELFGLTLSNSAGEGHTIDVQGLGRYTSVAGPLIRTLESVLPRAECHSGSCGGCRMHLLEGQVDWLVEPEAEIDTNKDFFPCCCAAKSDLRCVPA